MNVTLAIFAGLGTTAALWFIVRLITQRSKLARSLSFPLHVAALVAGFKVFTLFEIPQLREAASTLEFSLTAVFVFLLAVVAIRVLGLLFSSCICTPLGAFGYLHCYQRSS